VFKCKGCGKLDGYWATLQPSRNAKGTPKIKQYTPKAVSLYALEGDSPVYSAQKAKEIAREFKKMEKDPKRQCKQQFRLLVCQKQYRMREKGITPKNIERATKEVHHFINLKGPFTEKQLESMLSAAVTLVQDDLIRIGNCNNPKVTERQMENIFDVDRKTMRKWKKTIRENREHPGLFVYGHLGMVESEERKAEIPKDLVGVRKLDNPKKDICDFCGQIKPLIWRLELDGALWNDICQESYEMLKRYSSEGKWKIPNFLV
jgi:hypothetical protein